MAPRNDRTHSGENSINLSDLTIRSLDEQTQWEFGKWLPRFRIELRTNERTEAWNALEEAGCRSQDLEWALYWAIDSIDTASCIPAALLAFRKESLNVLRVIRELRPSVQRLMEARVLLEPVWRLPFGFFKLPTREVVRFGRFQEDLSQFETRLKQFTGRSATSKSITHLRAGPAAHGEAILHVFVEEFGDRVHHEESSILLEAAADAYNLEGTKFTEQAVTQRYTRYRAHHQREVKEIRDDMKAFRAERVMNNKPVDLIPFLLSREKIRAGEALEDLKSLLPYPR